MGNYSASSKWMIEKNDPQQNAAFYSVTIVRMAMAALELMLLKNSPKSWQSRALQAILADSKA